MKKTLTCLLLSAIIISTFFCTPILAAGIDNCLVLCVDSYMTYNYGVMQQIDPNNSNVVPIVVDGRTLVPARFLGEITGGNVKWDNEEKIAYIGIGDSNISIKIGESYMYVNSVKTQIDSPAKIMEGRTMIPLRAIANALGKEVGYSDGLIAIGSKLDVDTVIAGDCRDYIEYNFEPYMNKRPSIVNLYTYDGTNQKAGINQDVLLCGKRYNVDISTYENSWNCDMSMRVNSVSTGLIPDAGFMIYEVYLADINPWDNYVELFCAITTDNDYLMLFCTRFSDTDFSRVTFDEESYNYNTAQKILVNSDSLFLGQPEMAYNGLSLDDSGALKMSTKDGIGYQWGVKKTFYFGSDTILRQEIQPYYEVDMQNYYSVWSSSNFKSQQEKDMIKQGYALCYANYDFLQRGDYFKILFCDNVKNIYVQTTNGKQGWIDAKSNTSEMTELSVVTFFQAA